MDDSSIDPYRDWLGIVTDGAPSHYALLGLRDFEDESAVIRREFEARYVNVRKFHVGRYEARANALLEELSRAFDCLTDVDKKAQYDQLLRGRADNGNHDRPPPSIPEVESAKQSNWQMWAEAVQSRARQWRAKRPIILGLACALVVVVFGAGVAIAVVVADAQSARARAKSGEQAAAAMQQRAESDGVRAQLAEQRALEAEKIAAAAERQLAKALEDSKRAQTAEMRAREAEQAAKLAESNATDSLRRAQKVSQYSENAITDRVRLNDLMWGSAFGSRQDLIELVAELEVIEAGDTPNKAELSGAITRSILTTLSIRDRQPRVSQTIERLTSGPVGIVQLSPDGKHAIVSSAGYVSVHDIATGKLIWSVFSKATQVAFGPASNECILVNDTLYGHIWNWRLKAKVGHFELTNKISAVSPTGCCILLDSGEARRVVREPAGNIAFDIERSFFRGQVCAFSHDGRWLAAAGGSTKGILLLPHFAPNHGRKSQNNLDKNAGPAPIGKASYASATAIAVSPGGERVAVAEGSRLNVWETKSGSLQYPATYARASETSGDSIYRLVFSPTGEVLAVGYRRGIILWDIKTGLCIGSYRMLLEDLRFSADGSELVVAHSNGEISHQDLPKPQRLAAQELKKRIATDFNAVKK